MTFSLRREAASDMSLRSEIDLRGLRKTLERVRSARVNGQKSPDITNAKMGAQYISLN